LDGGSSFESHVIGTHGSLRFSQQARSSCASAKGDTWQDVPFDDPPQEFRNELRSFVDAITLDIEPPSDGAWGRHIMEILFAAEELGHHWARGRTRIRAPVAEPDQRLADHDRTWLALAARSRVTR
jgi:predicted dehydrogenase